METTATIESPFVLAYLAASRIIGKPTFMGGGCHAVGSEEKINEKEHASSLFAATFYDLRDRGAITLEPQTHKGLLGLGTSHVIAVARGSGTAPPYGGSAARLYTTVGSAGWVKTTKDAVYAWYGQDVFAPIELAIRAAYDEALAAGVITASDAGTVHLGPVKVAPGVPRATLAADRAAAIEPQIAAFVERWNGWVKAAGESHAVMMSHITAGIEGREEKQEIAGPG